MCLGSVAGSEVDVSGPKHCVEGNRDSFSDQPVRAVCPVCSKPICISVTTSGCVLFAGCDATNPSSSVARINRSLSSFAQPIRGH